MHNVDVELLCILSFSILEMSQLHMNFLLSCLVSSLLNLCVLSFQETEAADTICLFQTCSLFIHSYPCYKTVESLGLGFFLNGISHFSYSGTLMF